MICGEILTKVLFNPKAIMEDDVTFEEVAYHEAGHAVMAWYTQIGFEKIIVHGEVPDTEGIHGKLVPRDYFEKRIECLEMSEVQIFDYVLVYLGGLASSQIKYPSLYPTIDCMGDLYEAKLFCDKIAKTKEFKRRCNVKLERHLRGGIPYLYLNWLYGKSLMVLQEKWNIVERTVRLLHEKNEVSYEEFEALIPKFRV